MLTYNCHTFDFTPQVSHLSPFVLSTLQPLLQVADLVQNAREVMTASEQIRLYSTLKASRAVSSSPAILAGFQYDTAMAYVADGCLKGWPHYLHQADLLLQAAEQYAGENDQQQVSKVLTQPSVCIRVVAISDSSVEFQAW
jgi:hypothetical protein